MAHAQDRFFSAKIGGAVQHFIQKWDQDGDPFQGEALGAEIPGLDDLLEEVRLGETFQNLTLVRQGRRLFHALLDPLAFGGVGEVHELDRDAAAVIAAGFFGVLAFEIQFRDGLR